MAEPILLDMYAVAEITGLSVDRQRKLEDAGRFPLSSRIFRRLRVYKKAGIDAWVNQQRAKIDNGIQDVDPASADYAA